MVTFFMMITGKPFINKEKWAWFALVLMGIFIHGSHIAVDHFFGGLRDGGTSQGNGMMFFYLTIFGFCLYMVGAAISYPYFKNKNTK